MSAATLNRHVFVADPTTFRLPNDGVAKVGLPQTREQWDTLAFELRTFVCAGEYEQGLERILGSFLGAVGKSTQPCVWISGFYGSGKSHLARMLEHLWRNETFPDGGQARALVPALPDAVTAHLRELDVAGKRAGGLWSAAGMAGGERNASLRLSVLEILARAAGLPAEYPRARAMLYLKRAGHEAAVRAHLAAVGTTLEAELQHLYVSTPLAAAWNAAHGLDARPGETLASLRAQFPDPRDISRDEFVAIVDDILALRASRAGERPLTLLVLDEVQQFIGQDGQRAFEVQQVAEDLAARFGGAFLLVCTGQSALAETPNLQKLLGRFTVRVQLKDGDVDTVVREVVLRKDPAMRPTLQQALDRVDGEITRHLRGTQVAWRPEDRHDLLADYPILPPRRRVWERLLQHIDSTGQAGQLRSQLKVVLEATRRVAELPVGHVASAHLLYDFNIEVMQNSGVLSREVANTIAELAADGTPDGELKRRLAAMIFLIGRLPASGLNAIGLRATADTLADLLVEDLVAGSAELRARIPALLDQLVASGNLLRIEQEYSLQTRVGMEWEQAYTEARRKALADDTRIATDRRQAIQAAFLQQVKVRQVTAGKSKTPFDVDIVFGEEPPKSGGAIPVWVRDEWGATLAGVTADARAMGDTSPLVCVFLPRRDPDAIKELVARIAAAQEVLETRGKPADQAGQQAYASLQSRQTADRQRLEGHVLRILEGATVIQAGGSVVDKESLRTAVEAATQAAVTRLYPRFRDADHERWGNAYTRASQGNADALETVGYPGDLTQHPVAREILARAAGAGRTGSQLRAELKAPTFGWPNEVIDTLLLLLVGAGVLEARLNHTPITVKALNKQEIAKTLFRAEEQPLTTGETIHLRGLLVDLGAAQANDQLDALRAALPGALDRLRALGASAGGEAPRPAPPDTSDLAALRARTGNEGIRAVLAMKDDLRAWQQRWTAQRDLIAARLPGWTRLLALLEAAGDDPLVEDAARQAAAIRAGRLLLESPDPVAPVLAAAAAAIRAELEMLRGAHDSRRRAGMATLAASDPWHKLTDAQWTAILRRRGLTELAAFAVGTDDDLVATLRTTPLAVLRERIATMDYAFQAAISDAVEQALREDQARQPAPTVTDDTPTPMPAAPVKVRIKTQAVSTAADLEAALADLRSRALLELNAGHTVILE